ncbi:MAG: MFS transporter [Gammaproteobacteria bacterium]|nr:MFS transporter [Gammaproteobacteria bacterium]
MTTVIENDRKWWTVVAISLCLAIAFIDQTAVAVLLPTLHKVFGISEIMQDWVVNSYLLSIAAFIMLGGRLSDIIGHRRCLLIGLYGFMAASILCGISDGIVTLLVGRILQGIFGAILFPNTAIAVVTAFPEGERGTAVGTYVGIGTIFLNLGPLIGGFFTQYLTWRLVFLINIPIGMLSIWLMHISISRKYDKFIKQKIDWLGSLLLIITVISLISGMMNGARFGWSSQLTIGLFIVGFLALYALLVVERSVKNPLIDLNTFKYFNFTKFCLVRVCMQAAMMSRVFLIIYFQLVLGVSPFEAGLMVLPSTLPNLVMAPLGGRLLDRYGSRVPASFGLLFLFLGVISIAFSVSSMNYYNLLLGMILIGMGLPLIGGPLFTDILSGVALKERGMASGIFTLARQFGSTMGVALIAAVIAAVQKFYVDALPSSTSYMLGFRAAMFLLAIFVFLCLIWMLRGKKEK